MNNLTFNEIYKNALSTLVDPRFSVEEFNERTGTKIKVIPGGAGFKIDLSNNELPIPMCRKFHIKTCAAEIAWFFMGTQDLTWFKKYSHIWNDFTESDGTVKSAYGYRWRSHFGRDQIGRAISALKNNKSDRRVYVSNWDPSEDGLGSPSKNVPCPLGFSLSIVDGRLHMTMMLRSSDVFVGLPYDVVGHAMIMKIIAQTLRVEMGTLFVALAHAHLYENHFDMALETITNDFVLEKMPTLINWDLEDVESNPDGYVSEMVEVMKSVTQTDYNPRPDIVV